MNDPLDQDLRAHYAAIETPPAAELERRILDAVRAQASTRSRSGRKLALLAASLVIAVAVGWAVRSTPPKPEPSKAPVPVQDPGTNSFLVWTNFQDNSRDLRLTFRWPVLPNESVGNGRQTFRVLSGGQLTPTNDAGQILYFFEPSTYVAR